MRVSSLKLLLLFALCLFLSNPPANAQWWEVQTSGIDTNLRSVSAVYVPDPKANGAPVPVVWASGSNGVILKSLDEGKTWKRLHVVDGEGLDFRGIAAADSGVAYVISIGNGDKSRIYKTTDGGETWKLQFAGTRKETFLDAIVCDSKSACIALGDPVDGKFQLLSTEDGEHWKELPREHLPAALPNEGAFAASDSSLCVEDENIYFGTGGAAKARIFHSPDGGRAWTVADTPIAGGNASSGIFSLDCKSGRVLLAVGGDYKDVSRSFHVAAYWHAAEYLADGGPNWQLSKSQPGGFRSGVANVGGPTAVAVGPNGEDISDDLGVTWKHTDSLNLNAVKILDEHHGWAVGPNGTIARFVNHQQYIIRLIDRAPASSRSGESE